MSTELLQRPQVAEPGEHDMFSHYVRKADQARAAVMGTPVTALCGKTWVPCRDPDRFTVCPTCKTIFEMIKSGHES